MAKAPDSRASTAGTVLYLGPDRVELLHHPKKGAPLHATRALDGPDATRQAEGCLGLAKEFGVRPGAVQVVLAAELVSARTLSVPKLAPKELSRVLLRKAATLLDLPEEEVNFSATPLRRSLSAGDDAENRWMLMAVSRSSMRRLAHEMQKAGFKVRQVLWERLLQLGGLESAEAGEEPRSTLVVSAESGGVSLTLVRGTDLIHQASLEGDLGRKEFATVLIQEIRGLEAFWRKLSRGDELQDVRFLGLDSSLVDSLEPALRFALPELGIHRNRGESSDARADQLAQALRPHPFAFDLSAAPPLRKPRLVASAVLAACLAGYFAFDEFNVLTRRNDAIHAETDRLLARMRDQHEVEDRFRTVQETVATLTETRSALAEIGRLGAPLEESLGQALAAFDGYAALTALSLTSNEEGPRLSISGTTVADPESSLVALTGLVGSLEESPIFEDVVLLPPSSVETNEAGAAGSQDLTFSIRGRWRGLP